MSNIELIELIEHIIKLYKKGMLPTEIFSKLKEEGHISDSGM
jgi:hypothetical protein